MNEACVPCDSGMLNSPAGNAAASEADEKLRESAKVARHQVVVNRPYASPSISMSDPDRRILEDGLLEGNAGLRGFCLTMRLTELEVTSLATASDEARSMWTGDLTGVAPCRGWPMGCGESVLGRRADFDLVGE